jgi:hypothetical protein
MKRALWPVLLLFLVVTVGSSQMDQLLIYGDGWAFNVKEPTGWRCHTEDAYRYRMNAYFCLGKKNIKKSPAIMHISVHSKGGDSIQQSISFDIEDYQKHSKTLDLQEFLIEGSDHELVSKKYVIDNKTADYVCFLDPGKDSPLYLVFVLHGPKGESAKYETDFVSLVNSLRWMVGGSKGIKK